MSLADRLREAIKSGKYSENLIKEVKRAIGAKTGASSSADTKDFDDKVREELEGLLSRLQNKMKKRL